MIQLTKEQTYTLTKIIGTYGLIHLNVGLITILLKHPKYEYISLSYPSAYDPFERNTPILYMVYPDNVAYYSYNICIKHNDVRLTRIDNISQEDFNELYNMLIKNCPV